MTDETKSWLKDVANGALGTIIGILLTFGFDKAVEVHDAHENYVKITAATIINLERYVDQISACKNQLDYIQETLESVSEMDDETLEDSTSIYNFYDIFAELSFVQYDRWIEENFITKGEFIDNTDLRLKIGQVYSYKDLSKVEIEAFNKIRLVQYEKYFDKDCEGVKNPIIEIMQDKSFNKFLLAAYSLQANIDSYLKIMTSELDEIKKIADIPEEEMKSLRESATKLENVVNKSYETEE
ncbi:MAG: hypothetical protein MJ211_03660 [Bacteroidales bacterium]|nr:hypothetical protein [Bacteroidales bacterium]